MLGFFALLLAGAAAPTPAANQALPAPPAAIDGAALQKELDNLLGKEDYTLLGKRMQNPQSSEEFKFILDWSKEKWLTGNSSIVPFIYSNILWAVTKDAGPQGDGLKSTAAAALLYVIANVEIDGERCADRSAPGDRLLKIMGGGRPILEFVANASEEDRKRMIYIATEIARRTETVRDAKGDKNFVCRFGMAEINYNLKHGSQREVPAQPGQFGRQIILDGDGGYVPQELPETEWRPKVAKRRAEMAASLTALADRLAANARDRAAMEKKTDKP